MTTTRRTVRQTPGTRWVSVLAAVALAVGAAACTVEDKEKPNAAPGGGAPAAAVAPGVTADRIKIGVVYPDMAALKQFVNLDLGDFEAAYRALIDKANAAGGINGRTIVPVFGKINMLSPSAAQETCVRLTEDEKVFAVLGLVTETAQALCYTQAHKTALIGGPVSPQLAAQAGAPWFSDTDADVAAEAVRVLAGRGDLTGRKVAVVSNAHDQATTEKNVLPALQRAGVSPVTTGFLAETGTDAAALAQQSGVLLQKMQAAGADTVLAVGSVSATFPQLLEKTSWRPRLLFTVSPVGYLMDKAKHDYGTLKDAVTAAAVQDWDDPALKDCVATLEQADPTLKGKLVEPATVPAGQPTPGASLQVACVDMAIFKAIADKAGRDLTHASFQAAGFGLGPTHVPGYRESATFGPQTPHGAIPVRALVYDPAGKSFVPTPS
ncbi:ABC transporter substrate-binding protein [Yinghuangia seranimata]|uniref:ABC transporter substrate-binding protein n=1 Tax=Yinghuangia seranimata TaxID=408067 RepID=UPI00248A96AF|nr:ABC transporter substrate-binding protein [Yinghuangia seranimata]MDI2130121.1 ABC transporter substrate-binding protein [Yinghuangia seranimata]